MSNNQVKIALVVNRFPSLSESFLYSKVRGLQSKGFDVTLICHFTKNDSKFYADTYHKKAFKRIYTSNNGPRHIISNFISSPARQFKLIVTLLKNYKVNRQLISRWFRLIPFYSNSFDIVHFGFSGIAVTYLDEIDIIRQQSFVYTSCRGSAEKIKPLVDLKRQEAYPKLFDKLDRVHCVSEDMYLGLTAFGLTKDKTFVNPPSINTSKFKRTTILEKPNDSPLRILSVGRLNYQKGYPFALAAMKELKSQGLRFQYDIIGGGPDMGYLQYSINELGLNDCVTLHDRQPASVIIEMLEKAHCFLLSSIWEGIANSALEAMSFELPIISTDAGGMDESVKDGINGHLIRRFNIADIVDKIQQVNSDYQKQINLGKQARITVKNNFKLDLQIQKFVDDYNQILSNGKRG